MTQEIKLETLVRNLVKLEKEKFPEAKEVAKRRKVMRDLLKEKLGDKECLPEDSEYFAQLRPMKGRVSYRTVVDELLADHPDLKEKVDERIKEFRDAGSHRLAYGLKSEQLDLKFE